MEYTMTREERRAWWRELEQTEFYFLRNELRNREAFFPEEYRRYLEKRVAELQEKYGTDHLPAA